MGQDCKFCGAYIAGRADKCPACGKRINYKEEKNNSSSAQAYSYSYSEPEEKREQKSQSESYTYAYSEDPRTKYQTAQQTKEEFSADEDAKQNQLLGFLCYFGILFLIPYLARPNSDFIKFHSNQGLVLMITGIVINVASNFVPFVGWLLGLAGGIFVFACFIKGLINVYNLKKKVLPYIGNFQILK